MKFTNAYTKISDRSYLHVKNGNPRLVNPSDLTDKLIGFIDGFVSDEFCVKRQEGIAVSFNLFNSLPRLTKGWVITTPLTNFSAL